MCKGKDCEMQTPTPENLERMSPIERELAERHGNLHEVIPPMASEFGQEETARHLDVRQAWISRWLRNNGYERVSRYVRRCEQAVQS